MSITAHCLIRNEENFIWYAINSVLSFVDKVIVFDTGSTDRTVKIVKEIQKTPLGKEKLVFEERGVIDRKAHTMLRNEMIQMTQTDWFMILDGDEVWPKDEIEAIIKEIEDLEVTKKCILSKFILSAGDIYHYSNWGQYKYAWGLRGNYTPRFIKNIKGVYWQGEFDGDTLYLGREKLVNKDTCFVSSHYFFHFGILPRSSRDYEVTLGHGRRAVNYTLLGFLGHGRKLSKELKLPEVLFGEKPNIVPKVTSRLTLVDSIKNFLAKYLRFSFLGRFSTLNSCPSGRRV